jgi:hypothetical protein
VSGIPQLREASWFVTGRDQDPVRHLFLRLQERMDGSGVWTVELHRCAVRRADGGAVDREYRAEADARTAVRLIYALTKHLVDMPTWAPDVTETGRWHTRTYEPSPQDVQFRLRTARLKAAATPGWT